MKAKEYISGILAIAPEYRPYLVECSEDGQLSEINLIDNTWQHQDIMFDDDTLESGWLEIQSHGVIIASDTHFTIPSLVINLLEENMMANELTK